MPVINPRKPSKNDICLLQDVLERRFDIISRIKQYTAEQIQREVTINNIQVNQINPDTIEVLMEFQPTYPIYEVQVNCVVPSQVQDLDRIGENLGIKRKQNSDKIYREDIENFLEIPIPNTKSRGVKIINDITSSL